MTKPILWLGSSGANDPEFDPLLGRSAKSPAVAASDHDHYALNLDSQLFAEPEILTDAEVEADPALASSALPEAPTDEEAAPSFEDFEHRLDAQIAQKDVIEDWSDIVAWPVASAHKQADDTEGEAPMEAGMPPEAEPETPENIAPTPPAAPVPLLTRLFARPVLPNTEKGPSINEIWAKPEPITPETPQSDTPDPQTPVEAEPGPASELPPTPTKLRGLQSAFDADGFWDLPSAKSEDAAPTSEDAPVDTPLPPLSDETLEEVSKAEWPARESATEATEPAARALPPKQRRAKKRNAPVLLPTFMFTGALFMTLAASAAPLGQPFDLVSEFRWYLVGLAIISAGIWATGRNWKMAVSGLVLAITNLVVIVPTLGRGTSGSDGATAKIGWANVAGSTADLNQAFKEAEKNGADVLMVAALPAVLPALPAGWTLTQAQTHADPTLVSVFTKSGWRAGIVAGEPSVARPNSAAMTILGVYPAAGQTPAGNTALRDEIINRAGTRAGIQEGPTLVVGDFGVVPWAPAMSQFRQYGNVTRVRCGGWTGTTTRLGYGLIGLARDHAYIRDLKVHRCRLGAVLPTSQHKALWLSVSPKLAAPKPATN